MLFDKLRRTFAGPPDWRRIVLRDVERLLNDGARSARLNVAHLPYAEVSVLNHGLPPFAGMENGAIDAHRWATHFQRLLAEFEPRLDPRTIRVAPVLRSSDRQVMALLYDIHGVLLTGAERISLSFRIAMDYSCGAVKVVDS
jgi:type VI secretion system protein ImpF